MTPDPRTLPDVLLDRMKAAKAKNEPVVVSEDEVCWLAANYWPSVTPYAVALERIRSDFGAGRARVWGWPAVLHKQVYDENMRVIEAEIRKADWTWMDFVDWGRLPWWRRWLRRP